MRASDTRKLTLCLLLKETSSFSNWIWEEEPLVKKYEVPRRFQRFSWPSSLYGKDRVGSCFGSPGVPNSLQNQGELPVSIHIRVCVCVWLNHPLESGGPRARTPRVQLSGELASLEPGWTVQKRDPFEFLVLMFWGDYTELTMGRSLIGGKTRGKTQVLRVTRRTSYEIREADRVQNASELTDWASVRSPLRYARSWASDRGPYEWVSWTEALVSVPSCARCTGDRETLCIHAYGTRRWLALCPTCTDLVYTW